MKKIKLLILLSFILLTSSCDNWLELIPPDGLVQDEYWKTKQDVKAMLMGGYNKLTEMDVNLFLYGEVRGGLIIEDNNTSNNIREIMKGNIESSNSLCDWSAFYEVINYCNNVLKYNPIIFDLDVTYTEYQMKGVEAEALFLRSLSYFYLIRLFKEVPLVLQPTDSDNAELYPAKSTEAVIIDTIKANLLKARTIVSDDYGSLENNKGRASKNAMNALLADIALWNFEYESCIEYIEEIENTLVNLVPNNEWFSIFYPGNTIEGIFELQYDKSLSQNNGLFVETYVRDNYLVSSTVTDLLNTEYESEYTRSGSYRPTDNKIWKYCGSSNDGLSLRPSSDNQSANWIFYRYADMLLMKAEALSQLGRFDEAITYVNKVRERANVELLSAPQSASSFEDLILKERARELCFEGKRWFDLLRMGRRNDYKRKDQLIAIITEYIPSNQRLVVASKLKNPMGWYFPIEETEIERNNNLIQNPFYDNK